MSEKNNAEKNGDDPAVYNVHASLERIERYEELNNFITVCGGRAEQDAFNASAAKRSGYDLPLYGMTFSVKDNIAVAGVETTCASKAFSCVPERDAEIVEKLVNAGAAVVGKTNMDEFAMGSTNEYSAFGPVLNALDKLRVPGGSSGGAANSVAARQVDFAIGSDTGGSVRQPAAYCGVVGLKPTFLSSGRNGLIGLAPSLDTYGIFAQDCDTLARIFGAVRGEETKVETDGSGLKIGIADEFLSQRLESGVERSYLRALDVLKKSGAEIVRIKLPSVRAALAAYHVISSAEVARTFSETFSDLNINALGAEVKRRIVMGNIVVTGDNYDDIYIKACKVRAKICSEFDAALKECAVILSPTCPTVASELGSMRDPDKNHNNDIFTSPISLAGLPAVSVPFGRCDGMPVGIQIIGDKFDERTVLSVGKTLESNDI